MQEKGYESDELVEIVGSYRKGILKFIIFLLPVFLFMFTIEFFGGRVGGWKTLKPIVLVLLFYYALLSGYIFFNPKWIWDISYLRIRLSAVKPEPTKFYFKVVRIVMFIAMVVSLSVVILVALCL